MQSGQVYSCGHGQGGRLGHNTEHSVVTPQKIRTLEKEVCVQIAVGTDHSLFLTENGTVWSCGMNQYHQLGHSPPPTQLLMPKQIGTLNSKGKAISIKGVCASRFHSVFWSTEMVFTCGLNAGQLGHLKGDRTVVLPKQVTSLSSREVCVTHVASSDGAVAVATKRGDVYVLHEYQCRKITSRQLELEKIVLIGGNLDPKLNDDILSDKGGTELKIILLTKTGRIFIWRELNPFMTRCLFHFGREIMVRDIAFNRSSLALVTQEGEGFMGNLIHRSSKKTSSSLLPNQQNSFIPFLRKDQCDQIKLKRISAIYRAVSVACDPKGKNFAVVQTHPAANLVDVPQILPSNFDSDIEQLFRQTDLGDSIHDLIFQVGYQQFPAHRFVVKSSCETFYKQFCHKQLERNNTLLVNIPDIIPQVFHVILTYIYTGTCSLLEPGPVKLKLPTTPKSQENNMEEWIESAKDNWTGDTTKQLTKKGTKTSKSGPSTQPMEAIQVVQESAKKLGIHSLAKSLEKIKIVGDTITLKEIIRKPRLIFRRQAHSEFHDVRIRSEDGKEFNAHRVVLSARLEYFRSMFNCGWIEATKTNVLSMPIHSSVLEVILDYLYEDAAPKVDDSEDIVFIGNVAAVADQLLMGRLVSICESALTTHLTLKNIGEILHFSSIYNAAQLKSSCMQFICLNLPAIVETRIWNNVSEEVMEELTAYYRRFHPKMAYRCITPISTAPTMEQMELYNSFNKVDLATQSPRDQEAKKMKPRRKSGRKISESKEITLPRSPVSPTDTDNIVQSSPVKSAITTKWITVGKTKKQDKNSQNAGNSPHISDDRDNQEAFTFVKQIGPSLSPNKTENPKPSSGSPSATRPNNGGGAEVAENRNTKVNGRELFSASKELFPSLLDSAVVLQNVPNVSNSKKFPKLSQKQRKLKQSSEIQTLALWNNPKCDQHLPDIAKGIPEADSPWKPISPVISHIPSSAGSNNVWQSPVKPANINNPDAEVKMHFQDIIAHELQQEHNLVKASTKPLRYTQLEDAAMAELRRFYQADSIYDEYICVERIVPIAVATPVWRVAHH